MWYSNGEKYEGDWKLDERNGTGKQTDKDGRVIYEGEWKDDEPVKKMTTQFH